MDAMRHLLYQSRWHGDPVARRRVIVARCIGASAVVAAFMGAFWHGSPQIGAAAKAAIVLGVFTLTTSACIGLARPAWRITHAPTPGTVTIHPDRLVIDDEAILTAAVVLARVDIALLRTADGRDQYVDAARGEPGDRAAFLGAYPALPTIAIHMRRPTLLHGRTGGDRLFTAPRPMTPRGMPPPLVLPPTPGATADVLVLATPAASELLQWWLGTSPRQYDVG